MLGSKRIEIGKFLKIALAFQFAVIGLIGLDHMGIKIPILREVFCFFYLIFLPGIFILGILKLDGLSLIESILYSAGLSCSFLMFVGLCMNIIYPTFGITNKPLSTISLILSLTILISLLCLICLLKNPRYNPNFGNIPNMVTSPYVLSLSLLPFLAIFGGYSVCFYNNNGLLFIFIFIVALIPVLVALNKIPSDLYPLLIVIVAISLILHNEISSMYLQGSDIFYECLSANLVRFNSFWNSSVFDPYNSLLCNVILAPIFIGISGLDSIWIFKILYPFLFSLIPLGLFQVYKVQTNNKIAFLSCFFFISCLIFFTEMIQLAKQMTAEFYLTLLILLMVNRNMDEAKRAILLIIFTLSLVVSHYGLSYIFLISITFVYLMNFFIKKFIKNIETNIATSNFIMVFGISSIAWYMFTSDSTIIRSLVRIGSQTLSNISELFDPVRLGGTYWLIREMSSCENIIRILYIASEFFTIIGFLYIGYQNFNKETRKSNFHDEYLLIAVAFLGWLASGTLLPHLVAAGSLGFTRMFHISLIFLAPFFIVGWIKIGKVFAKFLEIIHYKPKIDDAKTLNLLSIFLMTFVLFNTSFVSEIVQEKLGGDNAISLSISQTRIENEGTIREKISYYAACSPESDNYGAAWIGLYRIKNKIYVDAIPSNKILSFYGTPSKEIFSIDPGNNISGSYFKDSYVFLRRINYVDNIMQVNFRMQYALVHNRNWWNTSEILPTLEERLNKIYSNNGSAIYSL